MQTYETDLMIIPVLSSGNILAQLETRKGFPVLDDHLQTSVPRLFHEHAGDAGFWTILRIHHAVR